VRGCHRVEAALDGIELVFALDAVDARGDLWGQRSEPPGDVLLEPGALGAQGPLQLPLRLPLRLPLGPDVRQPLLIQPLHHRCVLLTPFYVYLRILIQPLQPSRSATRPPVTSAASHFGSYPITASGAVDSDYTISYAAGTLSVTAAPLTI